MHRQKRLHAEAGPVAARARGTFEWLRDRHERARRSWRESLELSRQMNDVIETLETNRAIARLTGSAVHEREASDAAEQLRLATAGARE